MDHLFDQLTPAQCEAVRHVDGPLLILAGPGSGKTRVITHRIAHLLHLGIQGPESGLLRSLLGRPASFKTVALCPEDTLLYGTASVDTRAVLEAGENLFQALPVQVRRELEREVGREMSRELRHADMTLDDLAGLVGLLGPEVTVAVTTPVGGFAPPDIVAFVEVADVKPNITPGDYHAAVEPQHQGGQHTHGPHDPFLFCVHDRGLHPFCNIYFPKRTRIESIVTGVSD